MIAAFSIGPHQPSFMASSSFDGVDSPDLYHARAPSQKPLTIAWRRGFLPGDFPAPMGRLDSWQSLPIVVT
jgi:hypothetical protein